MDNMRENTEDDLSMLFGAKIRSYKNDYGNKR